MNGKERFVDVNKMIIAAPFLSLWERTEVRVRSSAPNVAGILEG
jgi:hypothetical protein